MCLDFEKNQYKKLPNFAKGRIELEISESMHIDILRCLSMNTDFFKNVFFVGGTALSLFYGTKRYSEDLDFTAIITNRNFPLEIYIKPIINMFLDMGINCKFEKRQGDGTIVGGIISLNKADVYRLYNINYRIAKKC